MEAQENVAVVGAVSGNRNGLFVPGTIEGVPVSMLIDSGAAVTVISPRIYAKMSAHVKKGLTATKWCVRSASGDNLSVEGHVELTEAANRSVRLAIDSACGRRRRRRYPRHGLPRRSCHRLQAAHLVHQ